MARPFENSFLAPVPALTNEQLSDQFDRQIDTIQSPPASGGGAGVSAFDVVLTPASPGHSTAAIVVGTINGLLPTNYASTYPIDNTLTYFLTLAVTASAGQLASATLSMPTTAPAAVPVVMGQPPLSFSYLLGVLIAGIWYRVIAPGSLTALGQEVYRTSKTSPAPGTLPYDIWYTWNLIQA